jgi:methylthioribose-1-phosphate isomerase
MFRCAPLCSVVPSATGATRNLLIKSKLNFHSASYEPGGREFESRRARQSMIANQVLDHRCGHTVETRLPGLQLLFRVANVLRRMNAPALRQPRRGAMRIGLALYRRRRAWHARFRKTDSSAWAQETSERWQGLRLAKFTLRHGGMPSAGYADTMAAQVRRRASGSAVASLCVCADRPKGQA